MKALIVTADDFEDSELAVPLKRLQEAGIKTEIVSIAAGPVTGKHGLVVEAKGLDGVDAQGYDLLLLPGGKAPERLRKESRVLGIVRQFHEQNKPIAAICHGPLILASAGLLKDRRATCYHRVSESLRAWGAIYEDRAVVTDGNLITSRQPSDLGVFVETILRRLGVNR